MDKRRKEFLNIVRSELIGPNPLPEFCQRNGEEIIFAEKPDSTYVSGILFPKTLIKDLEKQENESGEFSEDGENDNEYLDENPNPKPQIIDDVTNEAAKEDSFKPSSFGITVNIPINTEKIEVVVKFGKYHEEKIPFPNEFSEEENYGKLKDKKRYCREQVESKTLILVSELPNDLFPTKNFALTDQNGVLIKHLEIVVIYRMSTKNAKVKTFTFTLINTWDARAKNEEKDFYLKCFFQTEMILKNEKCFLPIIEKIRRHDNEDEKLNELLYRDVKKYAIGHGVAAVWEEKSESIREIKTDSMPSYEIKQMTTGKTKASLSMKTYAQNETETIKDLKIIAKEYEEWIIKKEKELFKIEAELLPTARQQISKCKECLKRINSGILLLETNNHAMVAFKLANEAMLLQQLHYQMPTNKPSLPQDGQYSFEKELIIPDIEKPDTWPNDPKKFGRWRPFQIAFLLLNLVSMYDPQSNDRRIVDLIWFPTGGGKTEAYLGLTAFTIFLRRIKNPGNAGTAVIMRYTLRLLTSQQFQRASALICACDFIRSRDSKLLGEKRITIGMWVGSGLTENNMKSAIAKHKSIQNGEKKNTSVVLKCPWCGSSMETLKTGTNTAVTPGYYKRGNNLVLECSNSKCDFSQHKIGSLPLQLYDDDIYKNPPTLLFGTVDKFAMLPFTPDARSLFGIDTDFSPPELIIQDELHLISGPLGSTVGHYETIIDHFCTTADGIKPKIITSTATISNSKRQCHALFACGEENVHQFPVQGISYDDNFFSIENKEAPGRLYCGVYGNAASSSSTTSIYLFAAEFYAANALKVESVKEKDPYWTNLCYFGSLRELGQANTWYLTDVKERVQVLYRKKFAFAKKKKDPNYAINIRNLYEYNLVELTSRMDSALIPQTLQSLELQHEEVDPSKDLCVTMCLATNMISVGVDVQRLGLMTVTGQPKTTSEYIQTTSRVGRSSGAPGIVFVIYNTSKSRDRSHYEKFQSYHQKIYASVEPISVTPFSPPLTKKAVHALFVALRRFDPERQKDEGLIGELSKFEIDKYNKIILDRVKIVDPDELENVKKVLDDFTSKWLEFTPAKYYGNSNGDEPLLYFAGSTIPSTWNRSFATPTSMRNVDNESSLNYGLNYPEGEKHE